MVKRKTEKKIPRKRDDNLSRYRMRGVGMVERRKGGPSKEQIAKADTMQVVRANISKFGTASRYAKVLRDAFLPITHTIQDTRYWSRLQSAFTAAVRASESSDLSDLFPHLTAFKGFKVNIEPKELRCDSITLHHSGNEVRVRVRVNSLLKRSQGNRVFQVQGGLTEMDATNVQSGALTEVKSEYVKLEPEKLWDVELVFPKKKIGKYVFVCIAIRVYDPINGDYGELNHQKIRGAWLWLVSGERAIV